MRRLAIAVAVVALLVLLTWGVRHDVGGPRSRSDRRGLVEGDGRSGANARGIPDHTGQPKGANPIRRKPGEWVISGRIVAPASPPVTVSFMLGVDGRTQQFAQSQSLTPVADGVRFACRGTEKGTAFLMASNGVRSSMLGSTSGYPVQPGDAIDIGTVRWGSRSTWIRVVDPEGRSVTPVVVRIRDPETGRTQETTTDERGEVHFSGLMAASVIASSTAKAPLVAARDKPVASFATDPRSPHVLMLRYASRFRVVGTLRDRELHGPVLLSYRNRSGKGRIGSTDGVFSLPPGKWSLHCVFGVEPAVLSGQAFVELSGDLVQEIRIDLSLPPDRDLLELRVHGVPDGVSGVTIVQYAVVGETLVRASRAPGREILLPLTPATYELRVAWVSSAGVFLGEPFRTTVAGANGDPVRADLRRAGGLRVETPFPTETADGVEASKRVLKVLRVDGDAGRLVQALYMPRFGLGVPNADGSRFIPGRVDQTGYGILAFWVPPGRYRVEGKRLRTATLDVAEGQVVECGKD